MVGRYLLVSLPGKITKKKPVVDQESKHQDMHLWPLKGLSQKIGSRHNGHLSVG